MSKSTNELIDIIKNKSLSNLSNDIFDFLVEINKTNRINIKKSFDFDFFKEKVRLDLIVFNKIYNSNLIEDSKLLEEKQNLNYYVENILSSEELLDSFTVYKIQQFINSVLSSVLEKDSHQVKTYLVDNNKVRSNSKKDKYIEYNDKQIDISEYHGFVYLDKLASYLYNQFDLKKMNLLEFEDALSLKNISDNKEYIYEINKLLFKSAVDGNNKDLIYRHPVDDDDSIFEFIRDGYVADRKIKKVYTF